MAALHSTFHPAGTGSPLGTSLIPRRSWNMKTSFNAAMNVLVAGSTLLAVVPLVSVLYMVLAKGAAHFHWAMFWELPPGAGMTGGGFGNALVGTFLIVLIATAISAPVGITTAIYLVEFSRGGRAARLVRFSARVLSGLPSIIAGVFIYSIVVISMQKFSLFAGGMALAVLMLPIITLSTEEALLRVSGQLREASYALGATVMQTVFKVVIPAGRSAILTGLSLAVARAAGESAPLIFTALFSDYWIKNLFEPTASLSVLIYNFSGMPYENQLNIAWTASLILILGVLVTNILTRFISGRKP